MATDARGHASADIKLPESLTTYRIMAVGGDKASRFGSGDSEIRINKPVMLKAGLPAVLARGDKAFFGSVVTSQLKQPGTAIVTMRSLDPDVLQMTGDARRVVQVGAGGSSEVRFDVVATAHRPRARPDDRAARQRERRVRGQHSGRGAGVAGDGRGVRRGRAGREADVRDARQGSCPASADSTSSCRRRRSSASAKARAMSSSIRTGARSSGRRARSCWLSAADLGEAFKLPGIDANDPFAPTVQKALKELEAFQCPSGGFAYWPGECLTVSPYPDQLRAARLSDRRVAEVRRRRAT